MYTPSYPADLDGSYTLEHTPYIETNQSQGRLSAVRPFRCTGHCMFCYRSRGRGRVTRSGRVIRNFGVSSGGGADAGGLRVLRDCSCSMSIHWMFLIIRMLRENEHCRKQRTTHTPLHNSLDVPKLRILTPALCQIIDQLVLYQLLLFQKLECPPQLLGREAEAWTHVIITQIFVAEDYVDYADHVVVVECTGDGGD